MKRRSLIKALAAGSMLTMTPLATLLGRSAMAQGTQRMRTIFLYHPNGCVPDIFFPTPGNFGGNPTFPAMSAPLKSVASQLVFLDGIGYEGDKPTHEGGALKCLTGVREDIGNLSSIDVQMGKEDWINRNSNGISKPSIQMGVGTQWGGDSSKRISYDAGTSLHAVDDPRVLYPQLFGSSTGGTAGDPVQLDILTRSREDLNRMRTQLGGVERDRLDQHLAALDVLESKIKGSATGTSCSDLGATIKPRINMITGGNDAALWATAKLANISDIQQDLAVAALSCGLTRTIAFSYGVPVCPIVVPGTSNADHDLSHQNAAAHTTSKIWWMDQFAKLIKKLADTPDVNGSLLDNTVLCAVSDLAHGNYHNHFRIPMFLAGGKNAGLVTGRSVNLGPLGTSGKAMGGQNKNDKSVNHSNVLMTVVEKAGYKTITMPTADGRINNIWTGGNTL